MVVCAFWGIGSFHLTFIWVVFLVLPFILFVFPWSIVMLPFSFLVFGKLCLLLCLFQSWWNGGLVILLTFSNNQLSVSCSFQFLFPWFLLTFIICCLPWYLEGESLLLTGGGWHGSSGSHQPLLIPPLAGRGMDAYLLLSLCSSSTHLRIGDRGREVTVGSDKRLYCLIGFFWCQHGIEVEGYLVTALEAQVQAPVT